MDSIGSETIPGHESDVRPLFISSFVIVRHRSRLFRRNEGDEALCFRRCFDPLHAELETGDAFAAAASGESSCPSGRRRDTRPVGEFVIIAKNGFQIPVPLNKSTELPETIRLRVTFEGEKRSGIKLSAIYLR